MAVMRDWRAPRHYGARPKREMSISKSVGKDD